MDRERVIAFRAGRHGLDARRPLTLAEAAACPVSDFARGSAAIALAARTEEVTREAFERAIDAAELAVAPTLRAAIHALAPVDATVFGRDLIADHDDALLEQLGPSLQRALGELSIAPREALGEVAEATEAALADGRALTRDELHAELRARVRPALLPWCPGCRSHHVSPLLWRYAGVEAGVRLDSKRRYKLGGLGAPSPATEAARRFLRFYAPATANELQAWAGLARADARRLWSVLEGELAEVPLVRRRAWALGADVPALDSPPDVRGVRLLPARDPFLQQYDREVLVPDADLRKRVFRPAARPGVVLHDGRVGGLWRARARGSRTELEVQPLERLPKGALEEEAARVAAARGERAAEVRLV